MSKPVTFGVRLPPVPEGEVAGALREVVTRAEELGLDAFWLPDRLTTVTGYLSFLGEDSVLDPLPALTYAAGLTQRIRLGTAVLVAPLRHPLQVARQLSTLQALAGDRVSLGVGAGWNAKEMSALGVEHGARGSITDEVLAVLRSLTDARSVSHTGRHFAFEDVTLAPGLHRLPILVAGGVGPVRYSAVGAPEVATTVVDRIARSDGWFTRPTTTPCGITEGLETLATHAAAHEITFPQEFAVAHANWCHLVEGSSEEAVRVQREVFAARLGSDLDFDDVRRLHWTGSLEEIAQQVHDVIQAGATHVVASPLTADRDQVDLWVDGVLRPLGFARPDGATDVRRPEEV
jgi:hypothetical protein